MKCQKCNQNEANTHITKIINGNKTEMYLCDKCAAENQDLINFNAGFDHEFENFFNGFFGGPYISQSQSRPAVGQKVCDFCGTSIDDIFNRGKIGCSRCYKTFADYLTRPLKQIHGGIRHTGKLPLRAGRGIKRASEIDNLQSELNRAVMDQNFERAAELRDKIKDLKAQQ